MLVSSQLDCLIGQGFLAQILAVARYGLIGGEKSPSFLFSPLVLRLMSSQSQSHSCIRTSLSVNIMTVIVLVLIYKRWLYFRPYWYLLPALATLSASSYDTHSSSSRVSQNSHGTRAQDDSYAACWVCRVPKQASVSEARRRTHGIPLSFVDHLIQSFCRRVVVHRYQPAHSYYQPPLAAVPAVDCCWCRYLCCCCRLQPLEFETRSLMHSNSSNL